MGIERRFGVGAVSATGIFLVAGAAVAALLVLVELLALAAGGDFFSTVILGADNRTSTSKAFIFMWTLLVGWALIALLIAGELIHQHHCVPTKYFSNAARLCKGNQVGLLQVGWLKFLHSGLSGSYLVLLGVPAAAAVAAKGITQAQVNGPGFKKPKPKGKLDPFGRVTEIFSADDGTTDIGDFQYVIFNLVTAVYFVAQFVHPGGGGLPTIPDTLLGLTSVSASLYVGKKAVSRNQPSVTGVFPTPLHDGRRFTVIGTDLTADRASPTSVAPQITVDGMLATEVFVDDNNNLYANAPPNISAGGSPIVRQLQVLNPYGGLSQKFQVSCL